jgi:hypothetical protein
MSLLHYNSSRQISDEILVYACYSVILLTVFIGFGNWTQPPAMNPLHYEILLTIVLFLIYWWFLQIKICLQ